MRLEDLVRRTFALSDQAAVRDEDGLGTVEGWDSLGHVNLMAAIEAAYGIRLSTREISELQTVAELKKLLARRGRA